MKAASDGKFDFTAVQEVWLSWADTKAADACLVAALRNQTLRPYLQPASLYTQTTAKCSCNTKAQKERRLTLADAFMQQMLYGCTQDNCTQAFCLSNIKFARRHIAQAAAKVLAMELATRAMENSAIKEYQPHEEAVIRNTAKAGQRNEEDTHGMSFASVLIQNLRALLGTHEEEQHGGGHETDIANTEFSGTRPEALSSPQHALPPPVVVNANPVAKSAVAANATDTLQQVLRPRSTPMEGLLPAELLACDRAGDPHMIVPKLDRKSAPAVASVGGKLLQNTLEVVLASPKLLSQCFVSEKDSLATDTESALRFTSVFEQQPSCELVRTVYRALDVCVSKIERRMPVGKDIVGPTGRALALATLFLAAVGRQRQSLHGYQYKLQALNVCLSHALTKLIFPQRCGSAFVADNRVRAEWTEWCARAPATVVRFWIDVLEQEACDAVGALVGGASSSTMISELVSDDPVRWLGPLELLRILADANDQLLSYTYRFSNRLHTAKENHIWQEEFHSPRILAHFDLKREIQLWVQHKEDALSPFSYPFLFGTDDKAQLHMLESHARMKTRYLSAHDRQAEGVQNQRVLHIDAHAEQLVRPNFEPEWPLLTSNRPAVADANNPYLVLAVRRNRLVQDAMDMLQLSLGRVRFPFKVRFVASGEDGVDMGGVQKEFFAQLMPQLLSPSQGLFTQTGGYVWPDASSPHELSDFELVGVFLGIAFANNITLSSAVAPLAPLLVSQLAYKLEDPMRWPIDVLMRRVNRTFPELTHGLQQLLEWNEQDGSVEDVFCRTFDVTVPDPLGIWQARRNAAELESIVEQSRQSLLPPFDHLPLPILDSLNSTDGSVTFPLIPGGSDIEVTASNRAEYVQRYLQFIGFEHARAQTDALRRGFIRAADGVIYRMAHAWELIEWLSPSDSDIDPYELERVASYDDEYSSSHIVIERFWDIVRTFDQVQLRQLLSFVTASDRIPLGGYRNITFVVQRNGPDTDRLPTALTCFGRLLLPAYKTQDKLRERLLTAIENASGFGLV